MDERSLISTIINEAESFGESEFTDNICRVYQSKRRDKKRKVRETEKRRTDQTQTAAPSSPYRYVVYPSATAEKGRRSTRYPDTAQTLTSR